MKILTNALLLVCLTLLYAACHSAQSQPAENAGSAGNFSMDSANTTPSGDVREEVNYYPGGGSSACQKELPDRYLDSPQSGEQLTLGCPIVIRACNWPPGETVEVRVRYGDSPFGSYSVQANESKIVFYEFPTTVFHGSGEYSVQLSGPSGLLESSFTLGPFPRPTVLRMTDEIVMLVSFPPGERLRLFAYRMSENMKAVFHSYKWFTVLSSGMLPIDVEPEHVYFAIGEQSGEVHETRCNVPGGFDSIRP